MNIMVAYGVLLLVLSGDIAEDLKGLKSQLRSRETSERLEALKSIASLSETPDKEITQALAMGLEDSEYPVRVEAARYLANGQDVDVAIKALTSGLSGTYKVLGRYMMPPKQGTDEALEYNGVRDYIEALLTTLRSYPDDRSVAAVVDLIKRNTYSLVGTVQVTAGRTLASLGTHECVDALISQMRFVERFGSNATSEIHRVLLEVAAKHGIEAVPTEKTPDAWSAWLKKNRKSVPKKLGRLKSP